MEVAPAVIIEANQWGQARLCTNEPPTVAQVMEFLRRFPPDHRVRAYEGEGGEWIVVEKE